ncbi:MAG: 3-oxoacyl-[acyl-carrier protein] reductase [Chloroflexota bacterium]|nr:3-oxoacyl-[acyl-carrier protein] reductase [Chloroflexota bacterium]
MVARTDEFVGKVALVTGGSRGIGRAIVLAFAELGASVTFCYRADAASAKAVVQEARRGAVVAVQADVGVSEQAAALVSGVLERHGRLDVLVNNAGVFPRRPFAEISDAEWEETLRTNLYSAFYCARAALPAMSAAGRGAIINMASISGRRGSAFHAHYAAAKGGLLALTRSLAKEAIPHGIRVNAVSPGRIDTEMMVVGYRSEEAGRLLRDVPIGRFGAPEEVAQAVIFLASDASSYLVGETLEINGGLLMD